MATGHRRFGAGAAIAVVHHPGAAEGPAQGLVVEGGSAFGLARAAGLAFDDVQVGQAQGRHLLHHIAVKGLGIAVQGRSKGGEGAQAQAGAAGADFPGHGPHHFQQQPGPVGDGAAIGAAAVIDAVAQELFQQVGVGAMHFHPVEAGGDGVAGSLTVVLHQGRQFLVGQGPGRGHVHEAFLGEGLGGGRTGGGGDRSGAAGQQGRMGDAAHVPQLQDDAAAGAMDGVGHLAPGRHLLLAVDARSVQVALGHGADGAGLGDDEAGTGALAVVLHRQGTGLVAGDGPVAGQGGHDDAVGQGNVADGDRIEQGRHGLAPRKGCC
eukprot:TRINITY_DN3743_c0_g1_i1.p2 TRINITY_DN3743_c0_g1~~TRINITY_DN3743_c0_g1_i1.p2  ORF type:complete len:321 (+),score=-27.56 TRINITY_DN3743_c0_g1_i1:263-1225(+)